MGCYVSSCHCTCGYVEGIIVIIIIILIIDLLLFIGECSVNNDFHSYENVFVFPIICFMYC